MNRSNTTFNGASFEMSGATTDVTFLNGRITCSTGTTMTFEYLGLVLGLPVNNHACVRLIIPPFAFSFTRVIIILSPGFNASNSDPMFLLTPSLVVAATRFI